MLYYAAGSGGVFPSMCWSSRWQFLWRPMRLLASSQSVLLTSIAMYAAVWHRGRQSFGIARFYQRQRRRADLVTCTVGFFPARFTCLWQPPFSCTGHLAPEKYEGEPYYAHRLWHGRLPGHWASVASGWVAAYFIWTSLTDPAAPPIEPLGKRKKFKRCILVERWVVLAHAVAFGSAYVLGATNASFLLVLVVHHEVQYLYFTYAVARWPMGARQTGEPESRASGLLRLDPSTPLLPHSNIPFFSLRDFEL